MIPVPDIGHVYPKGGLDADIRFDTTPRFVSTGSMFLDGTNDYLDLDGLTVTTSSANYSFSFWFKSEDGTSDHRFFGIKNNTTNDRLNLYMNATTIYSYSLVSAGSTNLTFSTSFVADFEDGTWHHAALVVTSGTSVVLYLDGQLVTASQTMRNIDLSDAGLFKVGGANDGTNTIVGNICHFGVWHDALTQAEVRALMSATTYAEATSKGGSTPRAYYLLEANANDSVGTQNGTLTNGAAIVGDRARLPSGFDLTGTRMDAQCFSGRAVAFDGTGDKIACGTALGDDLGDNYSGSFSVSFWAKDDENDGSNNDGVYEINGAGDGSHGTHACYYYNSTIRFALDGNAWYRECALVGTGWHHFVLVYTAGSEANSKVYIDGLEVSGTTSGTFPAAADLDFAGDTLSLGLHNSATYDLNGSISDWKFFKIALTAAQALELYQNPEQILPTGATAANLRSWYPLADYDIAAGDNLLGGLYVQDCGALKAHGLCTGVGTELSQPNIPQLGLRSSSSRILFDEVDDLVTIGDDSAIDGLFGSGGSIAAWIMPFSDGEGSYGRIVETGAGGFFFLCIDESGSACKAYFSHHWDGDDGTWKTSGTDLPYGEWTHIVITYNGSSTSNDPIFYINGSVASIAEDSTPTGTIDADTADKPIGNSPGQDRTFDGIISEVAMYKGTILDADAVTVMYNGGVQGFDLLTNSGNYDNSGDVDGWWKLDNPVRIADLSTNSNTGTPAGSPAVVTIPEGTTADLSVFGTLTSKRPYGGISGVPGIYGSPGRNTAELASPIDWGTGNWTISMWVQCPGRVGEQTALLWDYLTKGVIIRAYHSSSDYKIVFYAKDGTTGTNLTYSSAISDNRWIFICWRRAGTALWKMTVKDVYGNSYSPGNDTTSVPNTITSDSEYNLRLNGGHTSDSDPYHRGSNANITNLRIWVGDAITDEEVDALWVSGARTVRGT